MSTTHNDELLGQVSAQLRGLDEGIVKAKLALDNAIEARRTFVAGLKDTVSQLGYEYPGGAPAVERFGPPTLAPISHRPIQGTPWLDNVMGRAPGEQPSEPSTEATS